jgi:hypothetical protein
LPSPNKCLLFLLLLLHPNPVFLSIESWMDEPPSRDVILSSCEKPSSDSNISTLKGLSIDKRIMVSWSRLDKTTKQH